METIQSLCFGVEALLCSLFLAALLERLIAQCRAHSWSGAAAVLLSISATLYCLTLCVQNAILPVEVRAQFWLARHTRDASMIPPDLPARVEAFLVRNGWFELADVVGLLCIGPAVLVGLGAPQQ